jgi:hypothetical protein
MFDMASSGSIVSLKDWQMLQSITVRESATPDREKFGGGNLRIGERCSKHSAAARVAIVQRAHLGQGIRAAR